MRGKVFEHRHQSNNNRITPAYAGKSRRQLPRSCTVQDHPRLCGEKLLQIHERQNLLGSPPPMRGKAAKEIMNLAFLRITPAYAGKRWKLSPTGSIV